MSESRKTMQEKERIRTQCKQEKQQIINDTKAKTQCNLNSVKRFEKPNLHEKQLLQFKKKSKKCKKSIKNVSGKQIIKTISESAYINPKEV